MQRDPTSAAAHGGPTHKWNDALLSDITAIFESLLGVAGRPFGATNKEFRGVSDDASGVQWNIAVGRRIGAARLGVNLEGMKYKNWPIATFIESERKTLALLSMAKRMPDSDRIVVAFYRDAWQRSSRPNIAEKLIGKGEMPLSLLSEKDWAQMLDEALACLDESRGHRGRAKQVVTKSTGPLEMEVSPHLYIYTTINYGPASLRAEIEAAFHRLKPVHELVQSETKTAA